MINPLKITQEQFDQRWDELPESLRELLYSPEHTEIIRHICENNHLSEEKTETVLGIIGCVIMGFVHIQDMDHQIVSRMDLNPELARTITSEVREKVLKRFENEIEDVFQPTIARVSESAKPKKDDGLININIVEDVEDVDKTRKIPISPSPVESGEKSGPVSISDNPFILHEEKPAAPVVEDRKSILKSIGIPLGFFKKKGDAQTPAKPTKVEVESPARDEKRTVNYSELRTSISPFENPNFINAPAASEIPKAESVAPKKIEVSETSHIQPKTPELAPTSKIPEIFPVQKTNEVVSPTPVILKQDKPIPGEIKILGTIKKSEPRIEGNVIDLKN